MSKSRSRSVWTFVFSWDRGIKEPGRRRERIHSGERLGVWGRVLETAIAMRLLICVAILSAYGASAVVFERREIRHSCDDKTIEFTISAVKSELAYSFRLGSTNTLLTVKVIADDYCSKTWYGRYGEDDENVGPICDFFVNQRNFIEYEIRSVPALERIDVTLVYLFDTVTKGHVFRMYLRGLLYSISYSNGRTLRAINSGLSREVREAAKDFSKGYMFELLKDKAEVFRRIWSAFCATVEKKHKNQTDTYTMWYNRNAGMVYCSIQSDAPWWHNVTIRPLRPTTHRQYIGNRFMTFANAPVGNLTEFTCAISSPNGMVAIQNLSLSAYGIASRTTPDPRWGSASPSGPATESGPVTTFGGSDTITASGSAMTVAGVVIAIVLVICLVVCLFVFRDRLSMFSSGFRRAFV